MSDKKNQKLIKSLRQKFGLSEVDCSDAELLEETKNTMIRAGAEMELAIEEFKNAIVRYFKDESKNEKQSDRTL